MDKVKRVVPRKRWLELTIWGLKQAIRTYKHEYDKVNRGHFDYTCETVHQFEKQYELAIIKTQFSSDVERIKEKWRKECYSKGIVFDDNYILENFDKRLTLCPLCFCYDKLGGHCRGSRIHSWQFSGSSSHRDGTLPSKGRNREEMLEILEKCLAEYREELKLTNDIEELELEKTLQQEEELRKEKTLKQALSDSIDIEMMELLNGMDKFDNTATNLTTEIDIQESLAELEDSTHHKWAIQQTLLSPQIRTPSFRSGFNSAVEDYDEYEDDRFENLEW